MQSTTAPTCHPQRKHVGRGLCKSCYERWRIGRGDQLARKRVAEREWRRANAARKRAQVLAWRAVNGERVRATSLASKHRRRAFCRAADAPTADQLAAILRDPCLYCGDPAEHVDHFIPLARGGTHTLDNLVPACAACNLSKGAKLPDLEWAGRSGV